MPPRLQYVSSTASANTAAEAVPAAAGTNMTVLGVHVSMRAFSESGNAKYDNTEPIGAATGGAEDSDAPCRYLWPLLLRAWH